MASKRCTKCGAEKPLKGFHKCKKGRLGRRASCIACDTKAKSAYRQRRLQVEPGYNAEAMLRKKYGLTLRDYDALFAQQRGRCAICGATEPGGGCGRFAVDHDHDTGEVRALLCNKCTPAIGLMDDDPDRLEAAAHYLRAFKRG